MSRTFTSIFFMSLWFLIIGLLSYFKLTFMYHVKIHLKFLFPPPVPRSCLYHFVAIVKSPFPSRLAILFPQCVSVFISGQYCFNYVYAV